MRYPAKDYARAFISVLDETSAAGQEKVVKKLSGVLARHGDLRLGRKVVNEVKKILLARAGGKLVSVEVARENTSRLSSLMKLFGKRDEVEVSVNPSLVAGIRLTFDGQEELDYSLSRQLARMF